MKGLVWLVPALSLGLTSVAGATYSIVAADVAAGQIGGAGTSCLGGHDVYIIYGVAPQFGVVHAQSVYNGEARQRAVELLARGLAPEAVIEAITAADFDAQANTRQYAVIDRHGRLAAYTGTSAGAYAGHVSGRVGAFTYAAQGNILTSAAVLAQAAAAFESSGCDLAERLVRALEAGAAGGEGDRRCTASRGIPSDSAFVQVESAGVSAGAFLALRVPNSGNRNPMHELRARFDEWRAQHPCPTLPPVTVPDPPGSGGGAAGAPGAAGASGAGDAPSTGQGRSGGCGCSLLRATPRSSLLELFGGTAAAAALRRLRRRRSGALC